MTWSSIIIAGIITYFTRMTMVALVDRDLLGEKIKAVLAYVPSAVFPAIIFPAVFLSNEGNLVEFNDPKVIAISIAFLFGIFTKNLILTIISGLTSFWIIIFFV